MSDLIVENLCDIKYPYRTMPVLIEGESHTIEASIPYSISLKEKPSADHPVAISGYTESDSAPSTDTSFYVDYNASVIYFFSTKSGESVSVDYYGTGSPITAGDLNRFSLFLDNIKTCLFSFVVEALSGSRVRVYGGKFVGSVSGDTINAQKELFVDFGENGNYELGLITAGYSKKVLVGIDISTLIVAVIEGPETERRGAALTPSFESTFRPVVVIAVTGDNDGFVLPIVQSDILVVRNFLV